MTPPIQRRLAGLAVEVSGSEPVEGAARPTVVMLPGAMDRAAGFRRTIRHLDAEHVVAIDRRGYAGSLDVDVSDDLGVHADDLAAVCDAIGRDVVVVGHSQGGLIGLIAAASHRVDRLAGLVIWEPPMPWFEWYGGSAAALDMGDDPAEAAEFFMRSVLGDRLWERLPAATRAARLAEGPALLADLRASRRPGVAADLSAIQVPTAVGRGSESRDHHRRSAQIAGDTIPGAVLVEIEGSNHGVHLSHPTKFAAMIAAQLDRVDPERRAAR